MCTLHTIFHNRWLNEPETPLFCDFYLLITLFEVVSDNIFLFWIIFPPKNELQSEFLN